MSHDRKFDAPEFPSIVARTDSGYCGWWCTTHARFTGSATRCGECVGDICDECAEPIDETDLAPSCGAHRLHLDCRGRFDCRWCDEEWEDANS